MKKLISFATLLLFASCFATVAHAQIQLSKQDVCAQGTFHMTIDKTGGFDPGTSGPNKVWDFSGLISSAPFQFTLANYVDNGDGNHANLVKVTGSDTFDYFLNGDSNLYQIVPLTDFGKMSYPTLKLFHYPISFEDVSADSFTFIAAHLGSDLGMPQDSVKIIYSKSIHAIADAWGQFKLPNALYNSLRIKTETKAILRMEGKTGNQPYTPIHDFDHDDSSLIYSWYALSKGSPIASYDPSNDQMEYLISNSAGIEKIEDLSSDLVIANPIEDNLCMMNLGTDKYQMTLFDMQGRQVFSTMIVGGSSKTYDATHWPKGMLTMEVVNVKTKILEYRKLMKW